jgi:hypothetical protein
VPVAKDKLIRIQKAPAVLDDSAGGCQWPRLSEYPWQHRYFPEHRR